MVYYVYIRKRKGVVILADKVLTVRVPEETVKKIEDIATKLNERFGKKFSTSDILRSALERDLQNEEERKKNLLVKIPCHNELSLDEIQGLIDAMKHTQKFFPDNESIINAVEKLEDRLEYVEFLNWKASQKEKK